MDADQIRYGQTASEQDRQNLVEFLRYVHDLLQFIVDWRSVFLPRDYQRTIEAAWEEVRPVFADMQREILRGQHDEGLRDVGLTGAQLAFKLAAFNLARRKLNKALAPWLRLARLFGLWPRRREPVREEPKQEAPGPENGVAREPEPESRVKKPGFGAKVRGGVSTVFRFAKRGIQAVGDKGRDGAEAARKFVVKQIAKPAFASVTKAIGAALQLIDDILESLGKVLPLLESVKEIKAIVERGLNEGTDVGEGVNALFEARAAHNRTGRE